MGEIHRKITSTWPVFGQAAASFGAGKGGLHSLNTVVRAQVGFTIGSLGELSSILLVTVRRSLLTTREERRGVSFPVSTSETLSPIGRCGQGSNKLSSSIAEGSVGSSKNVLLRLAVRVLSIGRASISIDAFRHLDSALESGFANRDFCSRERPRSSILSKDSRYIASVAIESILSMVVWPGRTSSLETRVHAASPMAIM